MPPLPIYKRLIVPPLPVSEYVLEAEATDPAEFLGNGHSTQYIASANSNVQTTLKARN